MLFDSRQISFNIVLNTHMKFCTLNNSTKIYFTLKTKKKNIFVTKKNFFSKILNKDNFGRILVYCESGKLIICPKNYRKISTFIKTRNVFLKKKCNLINEIIKFATNLYLSCEIFVSKEKIVKILIEKFFCSDSLVDQFFRENLNLIVTRKILYYAPFNYV